MSHVCACACDVGSCVLVRGCAVQRCPCAQTILMQNLYQNPINTPVMPDGRPGHSLSKGELQEHFDRFYADIFWELEEKYGAVEDMNVCDNLGDHLVGNVYVMFENDEDGEKAMLDLNNRWYGRRPIVAELSPVTDFREACCRQYEKSECTRGGFCNFMHLRKLGDNMQKTLYGNRVRPSDPANDQFRRRGGGGGGRRGGYDRGGYDRG